MKKFNLMQVVPALISGGVEQGTVDLANHIAEKNIKNHIVSSGGKMMSYLNKKYVDHHLEKVDSKNLFKMPFIASRLNSIIKKNNINLLHIRSRAPAWLLPYIQKKNLTTISTFHNVYGDNNIFKRIYNKGLSRTDHIVAISKYVSDEITKKYNINPNKITIINRGIDTNFFDSKINDDLKFINFINKHRIPSDKKIILYPGRLTDWKGQFEFLEIIEQLKNSPFVFYFVGDDKNINYKKKLEKSIKEKKISKNCKLFGNLDRQDLKMMYNCCNLIISMPLKPEGFGRTISEGLAMKKMILARNIGGVKNQIDSLNEIYKIHSKDSNELVKKINSILLDKSSSFEKIKDESRNFVINNFSKKQMLDKYFTLYEKILK